MPSYTLELELLGVYSADMPGFEIWEDGSLDSSYSVSSSGTSISITVNYGGSIPSSLEFRFNDAFGELGRTIEIQSVKINDKYVNVGNYLSSDSLTNGATASVDIAGSGFFYDSSEPNASEFTTGATKSFTTGTDHSFGYNGSSNQVFDMLGNRDTAYLGSGNDKVTGAGGDDILRGGAGDDLLFGDSGDDRLFGEEGDDRLYGGTGNDRLHGNDGNDELYGGDGNDNLNGHDGNDLLVGGIGADKLNGGTGNDYLFGEEDNDTLVGAAGDDTLDGGAGDDLLYGGLGADIMDGGDDNDHLIGHGGNDVLNGDDGDDLLYGMEDNDELNGGAGNDYLNGGSGIDTLDGGIGADILVGGAGADILNGGDGDDIIHGNSLTLQEINTILKANPGVVYNHETNSFYQYVAGWDTYLGSQTSANASTLNGVSGHLVNITSAIENAFIDGLVDPGMGIWTGSNDLAVEGRWIYEQGAEAGFNFWNGDSAGSAVSSAYQDWIPFYPGDWSGDEDGGMFKQGDGWESIAYTVNSFRVIEWDAGLINDDNAVDVINGGNGNDTIYGYGGDDILDGGEGDDFIFAGAGDDTIVGSNGNDVFYGQDGNDSIGGGGGTDIIYGGAGDDVIDGGNVGDFLYGDDGNDTINGGNGGDTIDGGADNDVLYGGNGNDTINGGTGNDTIKGNDNDDILNGDDGDDQILGGDGNDTINGGAGNDVISGGLGVDTINGGDDDDTIVGIEGTVIDVTTLQSYGGSQDVTGTVTFLGNGVTLQGNLWKKVDVNYTITANTIVEFDFRSTAIGEVHSIGFDTDNSINNPEQYLQIYGTQDGSGSGIRDFDNYDGSGDWLHYKIDIGSYYTGTFSHLTLSNDHDVGSPTANSSWANIIIYESNDADTSADILNGDAGDDNITGNNGNNTINGGTGDDVINGFDGDDIINGNDDNDTIYGGNGTDTIDGGAGDDIIYGDVGNDIISGGTGSDTIYGGLGADTIYSTDAAAVDQIALILAGNPGVSYNASTGNFYQHITTDTRWDTASTNAAATNLNGIGGHLAVVSSAEENDYLTTISGGQRLWIGGSDAGSEGTWSWREGPENGTQFWSGGAGGSATNSLYSNWVAGDPSNGNAAWDYAEHRADGTWWANAVTQTLDYVIEWEGNLVLGTTGTNTMNGGDGADNLYGTDGMQDIFEFTPGASGTDVIRDFTAADNDALDISNLLTGFNPLTSDINDFVRFTNSGANALVQVDANGASGGASFTTIAQINDHNDLDADALYYNNSIIA